MNKKQLDEKHQKTLRKLLQLPENKKCFDCSEKGPFYACTTLGTFVCTTCSGIHREFQHHVKSISMASFKPEEVQFLEEMGNARAKEIWLAYWTPSDFPEPESTDRARVREFMKLKYERKKWFARPGTKGSNGTRSEKQSRGRGLVEDTPKVEPIESILGKDIPPISITHNLTLPHMGGNGVAPKREEARAVQPAPKDTFFASWEEQTHPAPPHAVQHPTTRSPQFSPQFPPGGGAPTPAPYGSGPAPTMPGSSGGGFGGLEAVFTATPEPSSTPSSTIWPPPQPGAAPHMMPGMVPAGGGAYPAAAVPFQPVSPQVFQQMPPAQQQQYLIMQQQWIQQQQFMLQQRMAHMSLGAPGAGATGAYPGGQPGSGPYPGAAGMGTMGTNPFLATAAGPMPTSPVLAPAPYGSAGAPAIPAAAGNDKKNDALFADLSPLAPKPAGGAPAAVGKATSSPLLPTMAAPGSPARPPAAMSNPFGAPAGGAMAHHQQQQPTHNPYQHHQQAPHNPYPSSPSFPAASPGVPLSPSAPRADGFNPFGSLI